MKNVRWKMPIHLTEKTQTPLLSGGESTHLVFVLWPPKKSVGLRWFFPSKGFFASGKYSVQCFAERIPSWKVYTCDRVRPVNQSYQGFLFKAPVTTSARGANFKTFNRSWNGTIKSSRFLSTKKSHNTVVNFKKNTPTQTQENRAVFYPLRQPQHPATRLVQHQRCHRGSPWRFLRQQRITHHYCWMVQKSQTTTALDVKRKNWKKWDNLPTSTG